MLPESFLDQGLADFTVKVNSLCNAECVHCFQYSRSQRRELELLQLADILPSVMQALADLGTRQVMMSIVGGEPCLLSDEGKTRLMHILLPAVLRAVQQTGLHIEITLITNLLVGPARLEWLTDLSKYARVLAIPFQFATSYENDTNRFVGKGSEARWRDNSACLRRLGRLSVQVTLTRGVCRDIENVINYLSPQFDSIDFQPLVLLPEAMPDGTIVPNYSELSGALAVIQRKQRETVAINLPLQIKKPGFYLGVDEDGTLSTAFSEEIHCNTDRMTLGSPDLGSWIRLRLASQLRVRIRKRVIDQRCRTCQIADVCTFGFEKLQSVFEPQACHGFPQLLQASL